jgi:hypothetical protein
MHRTKTVAKTDPREAIQPVVSTLLDAQILEEKDGELVASEQFETKLTPLASSFMRVAVAAVRKQAKAASEQATST